MMHDNNIVLLHVPAAAQKADALTKLLQRVAFQCQCQSYKLTDIHANMGNCDKDISWPYPSKLCSGLH